MFEIKRFILSFLVLALFVVNIGCSNNVNTTSKDLKNTEKVIDEDLSKYFTGYEGCFVLFDKNKNEYSIFNQQKSQKQVPPCSSFKIVNSLIGLETKVVEDENTTFNGMVQNILLSLGIKTILYKLQFPTLLYGITRNLHHRLVKKKFWIILIKSTMGTRTSLEG